MGFVTEVITKFGISYSNDLAVSGSFAFDPVREINLRLHEGLDEWRIGGSWLFRFDIINVNFGRNEFDDGGGTDQLLHQHIRPAFKIWSDSMGYPDVSDGRLYIQ